MEPCSPWSSTAGGARAGSRRPRVGRFRAGRRLPERRSALAEQRLEEPSPRRWRATQSTGRKRRPTTSLGTPLAAAMSSLRGDVSDCPASWSPGGLPAQAHDRAEGGPCRRDPPGWPSGRGTKGGSENSSATEPAPDRRQGGAMGGSPGLLRSSSGDCLASQGRKSRRRHTARWQLGQQVGRGLGNSANGRFKGELGGGRGGLHPADLPNVLTSCRFNFLSGRFWIQPPERGDVSAHGARIGRGGRLSLKCSFGARTAEPLLGLRS